MRKRIEEDKKKRGIPASDGKDEKRSGGELDRRARPNPVFSFYPNPPNPMFSI